MAVRIIFYVVIFYKSTLIGTNAKVKNIFVSFSEI